MSKINKVGIVILIIALFIIVVGYFYYNNKDNKPNTPNILSESEALIIAQNNCIKGGGSLKSGYYNENTKTWWFDANLNIAREGCNPACVVDEPTKTAEINWRCTGLVPDNTNTEIFCLEEQRDAELCATIYEPVCATVEIQCITTPCDPIEEEFSNSCEACRNSLVKSYIPGVCDNTLKTKNSSSNAIN